MLIDNLYNKKVYTSFMRDFNITRQIYLREFLIDFNKLYFPFNEDDTDEEFNNFLQNESEYLTYCKIIKLLKNEDLKRNDFFDIYNNNLNMKRLGNEIIKEEKTSIILEEIDDESHAIEILDNTIEKINDYINNLSEKEFINDDFYKYNVCEEDYTKALKVLKKEKIFQTKKELIIFGKNDIEIFKYDFVQGEDKKILKNFYLALEKSTEIILLANSIANKNSSVKKRFYEQMRKNISKDTFYINNISLSELGIVNYLRYYAGKKQYLFAYCYIAHYLNLIKKDILKLNKTMGGTHWYTLNDNYYKLYKTLFCNEEYLI